MQLISGHSSEKDATSAYLPVSCAFHDVLLEKATLKKVCHVRYWTELREEVSVESVLKDVYTENKEEFALLETGERIRLDRIIRIDGVEPFSLPGCDSSSG